MTGGTEDPFEGVSATELRRLLVEAGDRRLAALSVEAAQEARREQAILVTELQRRGEPLEEPAAPPSAANTSDRRVPRHPGPGSVLSGQPRVVTSRRRQHELLRSWSGWPLTSILLDPAQVTQVREVGWAGTHHHDPSTGERIVGTMAGLGFGVDESWHNPAEVIPWREIEVIARAVADEVRAELVEFRERWRAHQAAYPRFAASAAAVGCGPVFPGQPLTPRQDAYVREHEAFEASGVLPAWQQRRAALDAERLQLHDQALGADAGTEAGDLLELLVDQQLGPTVRDTASQADTAEPAQLVAEQDKAIPWPGLRPPSPQSGSEQERHQAACAPPARPGVAR